MIKFLTLTWLQNIYNNMLSHIKSELSPINKYFERLHNFKYNDFILSSY